MLRVIFTWLNNDQHKEAFVELNFDPDELAEFRLGILGGILKKNKKKLFVPSVHVVLYFRPRVTSIYMQ